ncbi:myeloid-associated differentiation marker homolog [Spinachia spinachia]
MPVIVLEARDFTSSLFLVRTWEVLSGSTTVSLVASLEINTNSSDHQHFNTLRILCMFSWSFFLILTLLIHLLSIIQFHSLIPISWKNLTMTVAPLGALMCLGASVVFPLFVMDRQSATPHMVMAVVAFCITFFGYTLESYVLRTQPHEQRGYMGSMPGLLKILQVWGGCHVIPLLLQVFHVIPTFAQGWQLWVSGVSYAVCVLMSLVTLVVILGDFAGRCFLPLDKLLSGFSLIGMLLYMVATVICFIKILQLKDDGQIFPKISADLVIMETVVACITLLAYTVDMAFSIKLLCDRSHT